LPEAAKFYKSIFDPPNAAPCTVPPGADVRLPAATVTIIFVPTIDKLSLKEMK